MTEEEEPQALKCAEGRHTPRRPDDEPEIVIDDLAILICKYCRNLYAKE